VLKSYSQSQSVRKDKEDNPANNQPPTMDEGDEFLPIYEVIRRIDNSTKKPTNSTLAA
jgi:hypothetical protein